MKTIDIIVAGNNYLLNAGLKSLVNETEGFTLAGEALNEEKLQEEVNAKKAQVLVIDFSTITYKTELIAVLKKTAPGLHILGLNAHQPRQFISKVLEQGVTSYLMLHCDKDEITEAIYKTANGERFLCGQIVEILICKDKKNSIVDNNCPLYAYCGGVSVSDREMEIIKCVAEGYSNQEIAEKLFISVHTVTTHRKNIMSKLGINNTAGLVMYAVREQLISPN